MKVAIARKEPDKFYFISDEEKWVSTTSRLGAHPEAVAIAMEEVISRWGSGNPATSPEVYHLLRTKFDSETEFCRLYFEDKKQAFLSQWFSRLVHRHSWTVRKTTVSQKVPSNWIEVAQIDSADQTFL